MPETQTASKESSKTPDSRQRESQTASVAERRERVFKTVKGTVGNFVHVPERIGNGTLSNPQFPAQPHVFSESEFARVYPIPKNAKTDAAIDPDTYHAACLSRLLRIGAIVEAPGEKPMQTPGNPNGQQKNLGIESAADSFLSGRQMIENQRNIDLQKILGTSNDTK